MILDLNPNRQFQIQTLKSKIQNPKSKILTICPLLFFEIKIQASFTVLFFGLFTLNLAEKIMCVSLPSLSPKSWRKRIENLDMALEGKHIKRCDFPEQYRACQPVHRHRSLTILA